MSRSLAKLALCSLICCHSSWTADDIKLDSNWVSFDLTLGQTPAYNQQDANKIRMAALSLAFHSISWKKEVSKPIYKNGKAYFPKSLLSNAQWEYLKSLNPHDCEKEKRLAFRSDWFISEMTKRQLDLLFEGKDIEPKDLFSKLGLSKRMEQINFKKTLFASPTSGAKVQESRIAAHERAVLLAEGKHGDVFVTIDRNAAKEIQFIKRSADPFHFRTDDRAGEIIFQLPNGLHGYAIIGRYEVAGELTELSFLVEADSRFIRNKYPTSAAYRGKNTISARLRTYLNANGETITNARDCLTCHREGLFGPQRGMRYDKTTVEKILTQRSGKPSSINFLDPKLYETRVAKNNKNYQSTLNKIGAQLQFSKRQAPTVADMSYLYTYGEVPLETAATELRTTKAKLLKLMDKFKSDLKFRRRVIGGINVGDDIPFRDSVPRRPVFDRVYCLLLSELSKLDNSSPRKRTNHRTQGAAKPPFSH